MMLRETILKECQPLLVLLESVNVHIKEATDHNYVIDIPLTMYSNGVESVVIDSFTRNAINNEHDSLSPENLLEAVKELNSELKRLRIQGFDIEIVRDNLSLKVCQVYVIVIKPKIF